MKNTLITYLYRDGCNYKQWNEAVLCGKITKKQIAAILSCLDEGLYFIPRQVGLEEIRFSGYDPDSDHAWFELTSDDFQTVDRPATSDLSVSDLTDAFQKAAEDGWDELAYLEDIVTKLAEKFN